MKKILFLVFVPLITMAQINERGQKQSFRNGGGSSPSRSYSPQSFGSRPSIGEFEQKQIERNRLRQSYNNKPGSNVYLYDPWGWNNWDPWGWNNWGWGWNRWYPYSGWNYYDRFWWNDNWGYRNPGRVYIYEDGKRDTVRAKPLHGAFGFSYNNLPEWGLWGTLGREVYFIAEYSKSFQPDRSTFYPEITKENVLEWKDTRLKDQVNTNLFSFGVGKKINKSVGLHAQIGFGKRIVRQKYLDELYILSNNGQYSIEDYSEKVTTFKLGGLVDISKSINLKLDHDLNRQLTSVGVGVRF